MSAPATRLQIDGDVAEPVSFSFDDLAAFSEVEQVRDVSRFHPKRPGDGVTLRSLLNRVCPRETADYLTLHATKDDFAASIPLAAIVDEAILVYQLDGAPYPEAKGGPFRFLIKNPAACHTDELDDCANVKFVDRIELTSGKGRDTRPHDEVQHEALHAK
ncbi:MAG: molybdopterin-dependent oxidoreductase [Planctomycetia bacterium]|nr:molybdopterin-dependent oxidoreductase [Planctomycetia bacterium]